MGRSTFGDVIVWEGDDLFSKMINYFTDSNSSHVGLRTKRNILSSVGRDGRFEMSLLEPDPEVLNYTILRHKDMDSDKRWRLRLLDKKLPNTYDRGLVRQLGIRHLLNLENDMRDISNTNKYICSTRIAFMYNEVGLSVYDGVHWSQTEPHHFTKSPYFERVKYWEKSDGSGR
jgi:hypothetical protein